MKWIDILYRGIIWVFWLGLCTSVYGFQNQTDSVNRSPVWSFSNNNTERGFYMIASGNLDPSDDHHELLVNEPFYKAGAGRVYYFSDLQDTIPDIIFSNPRGDNMKTLFGVSISTGDINRDGLEDIVIGERSHSNAFSSPVSGQVYIYFGKSNEARFETKPDITLVNPGNDGEGAADNFGDYVHVVSTTTPILTNGIPIRLFVSARNQNQGTSKSHTYGAVYGYDETGSLIWTLNGKKEEYLGKSVIVDDVDANGSPDLLVGGARTTLEEPSATGGVVQVWLTDRNGSLNPSEPSFYIPHPEEVLETSTQNLNFGYTLITGDLNGNGVTDLLISDPYADDHNSAVYLYEGPIMQNDKPEWILRGKRNEELYEFPKLRGLDSGDLNNDGMDDIIIGAPNRAIWSNNARVYIIYGGEISNFPGTGMNPRIAFTNDLPNALGASGIGNIGEHGVIAPLISSEKSQLNIATAILASGKKKNLQVFVFSPYAE